LSITSTRHCTRYQDIGKCRKDFIPAFIEHLRYTSVGLVPSTRSLGYMRKWCMFKRAGSWCPH
jgi:hypothetical protein